jgi:hypothetical protein
MESVGRASGDVCSHFLPEFFLGSTKIHRQRSTRILGPPHTCKPDRAGFQPVTVDDARKLARPEQTLFRQPCIINVFFLNDGLNTYDVGLTAALALALSQGHVLPYAVQSFPGVCVSADAVATNRCLETSTRLVPLTDETWHEPAAAGPCACGPLRIKITMHFDMMQVERAPNTLPGDGHSSQVHGGGPSPMVQGKESPGCPRVVERETEARIQGASGRSSVPAEQRAGRGHVQHPDSFCRQASEASLALEASSSERGSPALLGGKATAVGPRPGQDVDAAGREPPTKRQRMGTRKRPPVRMSAGESTEVLECQGERVNKRSRVAGPSQSPEGGSSCCLT